MTTHRHNHVLTRLTPQQMRVLRLCTEGKDNESIADALSISQHTVQAHLKNIKEVVQIENDGRRWLVALSYQLGRAEEKLITQKKIDADKQAGVCPSCGHFRDREERLAHG